MSKAYDSFTLLIVICDSSQAIMISDNFTIAEQRENTAAKELSTARRHMMAKKTKWPWRRSYRFSPLSGFMSAKSLIQSKGIRLLGSAYIDPNAVPFHYTSTAYKTC